LLAAALMAVLAIRRNPPGRIGARRNRFRTTFAPEADKPAREKTRGALPALGGAACGIALFPVAGPPAVVLAGVLAVMGWLAPRLLDERRRDSDRAAALGQVQLAMALLRAQIAMGLGLESALRNLALSQLVGRELANRLRSVLAAYGLGRSVELALAQQGRELESVEIEILARSISQARRLGVGLEETLARAEFEFVTAHERRVAAAAERAQLRSQLLIVGCFLPAFMAMVLIPLFLGMLQGLGS
jgi:tight adherence protein C